MPLIILRLQKSLKQCFCKRHSFKAFKKSNDGATALEFAMVAMPFLYVICSLLEMGIMLFCEYSLQAAVTTAARDIKTGQAQTADLKDVDFKKNVCAKAGTIVKCRGVTIYVNAAPSFAALANVLPNFVDVGTKPDGSTNPTTFGCGSPKEAVGVIATYDWKFNMPFLSMLSNTHDPKSRRLVGLAVFQNEPFPGAAGTC